MSKIPLLPVLLVKSLRYNTWLRNQGVAPNVLAAPNYPKILDDIGMNERWEPTLTLGFLEKIGLNIVDST